MSSPAGARPGTLVRSARLKHRGTDHSARSSLITTWSPKCRQDLTISTIARAVHFFNCEGDPTIVNVDYRNIHLKTLPDAKGEAARLAATTVNRGGIVQLHILGSQLEISKNQAKLHDECLSHTNSYYQPKGNFKRAEIVYATVQEIVEKHEVRIRNWFEAISFIAIARNHHLAPHERLIDEVLQANGAVTAGELQELEDQGANLTGLLLAAAFQGAGVGRWLTDMDEKAISLDTVFQRVDRETYSPPKKEGTAVAESATDLEGNFSGNPKESFRREFGSYRHDGNQEGLK